MTGRLYACVQCHGIYRAHFARCPNDGGVITDLVEDPLLGTTVGQFVIDKLLGQGGSGRVYRARDLAMRSFAIKVLFGDLAADLNARARILREAVASRRLHHPNVVRLVEVGESADGLVYMVMEHVRGPTLAELLAASGPLPLSRVVDIARCVAEGLAHAHDHGFIHRDLKTTNVLLHKAGDGDEVPKIADFGLAIAVNVAREDRVTGEGRAAGTLGWMSLEQARGAALDHRTDLFNLGLLLFEMFTGLPPFDGTPAQRNHSVLTAPIPPIAVRAPEVSVPEAAERLVAALTAKEREQRPASAREVIAALDRLT